MRKIKLLLLIFWRSLISVYKNLHHLYKGQSTGDYILQVSHRLEKGMCISVPKPLWGWDKAFDLAQTVLKEQENLFAKKTGIAVLQAYVEHKRCWGNEKDLEKLKSFEIQYGDLLYNNVDEGKGGAIILHKSDVLCDLASAEKLFNSRHSIRDFDDSEVPLEKIYKAIEMANRCPSACNRQPSHVYLIQQDLWHKYTPDMNQAYNCKQHLLITVSRSAYTIDEINDWIVSASIFAGYLSLSLTAVGIGSCVIKKSLLNDNAYKQLKRYCGIPDDEKIILEIAIGNYKESFSVPISNRKTIKQLLTIVE